MHASPARTAVLFPLLLAVVFSTGCRGKSGGDSGDSGNSADSGTTGDSYVGDILIPPPATCAQFTFTHDLPSDWTHTATCSDSCGNGLNPPTGGPHCSDPLACRSFTTAQPRCQWIHNLEHGHAVLLYNCPSGCPEIVTGLEQLQAQGKKGTNSVNRTVIAPDPLLPNGVTVAAVVAGWSYVSDTLNKDAIACLLEHQDGDAPEKNLPCSP